MPTNLKSSFTLTNDSNTRISYVAIYQIHLIKFIPIIISRPFICITEKLCQLHSWSAVNSHHRHNQSLTQPLWCVWNVACDNRWPWNNYLDHPSTLFICGVKNSERILVHILRVNVISALELSQMENVFFSSINWMHIMWYIFTCVWNLFHARYTCNYREYASGVCLLVFWCNY